MTGNEWDIQKIAAILVQSLIPSILPILPIHENNSP